MDVMQTRAIGAGVFFVAIFASGFWLSQTGRPLNDIILTIHKLIGVAALVFLGAITYRIHQDASLSTGQIAAVAGAGLLFGGAIVSGGVLSIDADSAPAGVLALHRVFSALTVLAASGMLYVLLRE